MKDMFKFIQSKTKKKLFDSCTLTTKTTFSTIHPISL